MKAIPYIPETAPFTPEQRAWLNGFLAGLWANGGPGEIAALPPPPTAPAEPLLILYGSQTGTAEALSARLVKEARLRGFAPAVFPLNDYDKAGFSHAGKAVIISSTWGDGDPPDNAAGFWSWLNATSSPRLESLRFGILGLGDRSYADFCGASKKFDARLEALGARRLLPRGECDVDYEAAAKEWIEALWRCLSTGVSLTNGRAERGVHDIGSAVPAAPAFGKTNPFPARLLRNVCLNKTGSSKDVWHHEISLDGSGLAYEAGDALGVLPLNCPSLVNELLSSLRCSGDETVKLGDNETSLRDALTRQLEIVKPPPSLLEYVARRAPECELAPLLAPDRVADLKQWVWGRDIIDIIRLLPEPAPAAEFVSLLRKLAPRLYSIASSPKAHPGEAHLCVGAVRYHSHGRKRHGVASVFLAERLADAGTVRSFVQHSPSFRPPADGDAPMIMVGPGTGVAPFRAFLEERQVAGAKGKNWLFFGDQKRATDFLYEEELARWVNERHLARLDLAFSRDQAEKVYVQDRMVENALELWSWLEEGAHFYVCGDASRMASDVDAALHRVIETAGNRSPDDARAYVSKLRSERRYQRDVY